MDGSAPRRPLLQAGRLLHRPNPAGHILGSAQVLIEERGATLGPYAPVPADNLQALAGEIVPCPPSALADRWARSLPDAIPAAASGWLRIRARAKQQGVELPLIVSGHCDWPQLVETIHETGAGEIWVTHGREDALVHYCRKAGLEARALSLLGHEEGQAG